MTVWHLGPLHPAEQALTLLLAFGPFVFLAVVIWWRRRQDAAEPGEEEDVSASASRRPPTPGS
jgi:uncharacterized iron-regulated membrane protein